MTIHRTELGDLLLHAGRNDGPAILVDWWVSATRPPEQLRAVIAGVWQLAQWPTMRLGVATWVALFCAAGFVSDTGEPPPAEPWIVYRGTTWGRRRGMSWTTSLETAQFFAARLRARGYPSLGVPDLGADKCGACPDR